MTHALGYTKAKGGEAADKYALREGQVLYSNMIGQDPGDRHSEFELDRARHPRTDGSKMVIHSILSLPPGHHLSTESWKSVIDSWRKKIGSDGNFVATLHPAKGQPGATKNSTDSAHIHIVWSRSNRDGTLVNMSFDLYKHRQALHQVADELLGGWEVPRDPNTSVPATTPAVRAQRRSIRMGLEDPWIDPTELLRMLDSSSTAEQFSRRLEQAGIEIKPAVNRLGKATGILFRRKPAPGRDTAWLAGGSFSRELTLPKIQARLELNRIELVLKREQEMNILLRQQQDRQQP